MEYFQSKSIGLGEGSKSNKVFIRTSKASLMKKQRSRELKVEKERLYRENNELKIKNNELSNELHKIKTKVLGYEAELGRIEQESLMKYAWEKPKSLNLMQNLKKSVKELKNTLDLREKEIHKLKSNMKCSRYNELELEVQAYIDECTRLKHHLEETLKIADKPSEEHTAALETIKTLEKEKHLLDMQINSDKSEINSLKTKLEEAKRKRKGTKKPEANHQSEILKMRKIIENCNKESFEKDQRFQNEIKNLKSKLERANSRRKEVAEYTLKFKPKAPELFLMLSQCIPEKFKSTTDLVSSLISLSSFNALYNSLKSICPSLQPSHLTETSEYFQLESFEDFPSLLKEWLPLFNYSKRFIMLQDSQKSPLKPQAKPSTSSGTRSSKPQENKKPIIDSKAVTTQKPFTSDIKITQISDLLLKVTLDMQIHRMEKQEFKEIIGQNDEATVGYLTEILQSEPFVLQKSSASELAGFLVGQEDSAGEDIEFYSVEDIFKKFCENTENWKVFTEEEEKKLYVELCEVISKNKEDLAKACEGIDKEKSGNVTELDFQNILADLSVTFSVNLRAYCRLLCYSVIGKVKLVPYIYLVSNFILRDSNSEEDDYTDEIATLVRGYLKIIATKMKSEKISVSQLFKCNTQGLISEKAFRHGLSKLSLKEIPSDHIKYILEALQYEGSTDICVFSEELEETLKYFTGKDSKLATPESSGIIADDSSESGEDYEDDFNEDYQD